MKKIFSAGNLALFFSILVTSVWTFWGVTEMFHEGWYSPFEWLYYLLPAALSLALTLIALTWPRFGGWLLICAGLILYTWVISRSASRIGFNLRLVLSWFPVGGCLALIGVLFLLDAGRGQDTASTNPTRWERYRRHFLAIGVPVLLGVGLAIKPAINLANCLDDGDYGARLIPGNDIELVWAPSGPGWKSGVTWNQLALYGLAPVGLEDKSYGRQGRCNKDAAEDCATSADMQQYNVCLYLSQDGSNLETIRQGYWRMPTTDEVVRSLVRQGKNAACTWNGRVGKQPCAILPDKETPLWNPKSPLIYLWTADEANREEAYYVTYHGSVERGSKFIGLGSQGYRCVRATGE